MGILANSEDPDKIAHDAVFQQGLNCLLTQIHIQRKKYIFFLKNRHVTPQYKLLKLR